MVVVERQDEAKLLEARFVRSAEQHDPVRLLPGTADPSAGERSDERPAGEGPGGVAGKPSGKPKREGTARPNGCRQHVVDLEPRPRRRQSRGGYRRAVSIDQRVDIGHVHLKVSDIDQALSFYRDILGFDVTQRIGDQAAFISAGGYHHHLGLNTWESRGGSPPPPGTTGLYHVAIRYPDRRTLGDALRRLADARWPIDGASDHGVSEAIYLRDPDGNGIELYRDRPEEDWPRAENGEGVAMVNAPLDLDALLREAG